MVSLIADASVHYVDNNSSHVDNTGLTERTGNYAPSLALMKMCQYCILSHKPPIKMEMS